MYKILIADDELVEINILNTIINAAFPSNVEVQRASNGKMAKSMALLWSADIILMDIEMPVMSGIEAAREILKENRWTKIIFITAYPLFSYARDAVQLGAIDYILKPVRYEDVVSSIEKAVRQIETMRQLRASKDEMLQDIGESKNAHLIAKVKGYLRSNYMNYGLSLESVADLIGVNASYLSSMFKKEAGINFIDYVVDLRISAAKELLKDPLRSAGEIAEKTGFESSSYFTRTFNKKTGMTPTEYRSKAGGGKDI